MTKKKLVFVTSNKNKVVTLQKYLEPYDFEVEQRQINIGEIQESSIEKVAVSKALASFNKLKKPLIVEDSGFFIEGLKGFPGPYAKYINETVGIKGLLSLTQDLENRKCKFIGVLVYIDEDFKINTFIDDSLEGTLSREADQPCGEAWSDLWNVFIPDNHSHTLAAMIPTERDELFLNRKEKSNFFQLTKWLINEAELKNKSTESKKVEVYQRPSWDEYFIGLTDEIGKRATCDRGRSGCVIVRDKRILCTGYVGSPPGLPHCDEVGHMLKQVINDDGYVSQHCIRTIHAEQNAICQAAKYGISLEGTTLYCKMEPCKVCAMIIISVGIKKVVAKKRYHGAKDTEEMFKQAGIEMHILDESYEQYENQV